MLIDLLTDATKDEFVACRERSRTIRPHQPKPGDPDYQTPEQVARIKADHAADHAAILQGEPSE